MCAGAPLVPVALAAALLLSWLPDAAAGPPTDAGLAADDECLAAAGAGRGCALNALQHRGTRAGGDMAPLTAGHDGERQQPETLLVEVGCHTARKGEACFREVHWAMRTGIREHPRWYRGLTPASSFEDFQWAVHAASPGKCPEPCGGTPGKPGPAKAEPAVPELPVDPSLCLCVFDIDRTLTGQQGSADGRCPHDSAVPGIEDNAYGGGELVLSALSTQGLSKTFCSSCYLGLCSHGNANSFGSKERSELMHKVLQSGPMQKLRLRPEDAQWSDEKLLTPYVVYAPDGKKQLQVERILDWYRRQGLSIGKENTYFFDDRADNVLPFTGTGMNARQISCDSRDMSIGAGAVGLCGATPQEIVRKPGIKMCPVNCRWSQWSAWSACSATCGPGKQRRVRAKSQAEAYGGSPCRGAAVAEAACGAECPAPAPEANDTAAEGQEGAALGERALSDSDVQAAEASGAEEEPEQRELPDADVLAAEAAKAAEAAEQATMARDAVLGADSELA